LKSTFIDFYYDTVDKNLFQELQYLKLRVDPNFTAESIWTWKQDFSDKVPKEYSSKVTVSEVAHEDTFSTLDMDFPLEDLYQWKQFHITRSTQTMKYHGREIKIHSDLFHCVENGRLGPPDFSAEATIDTESDWDSDLPNTFEMLTVFCKNHGFQLEDRRRKVFIDSTNNQNSDESVKKNHDPLEIVRLYIRQFVDQVPWKRTNAIVEVADALAAASKENRKVLPELIDIVARCFQPLSSELTIFSALRCLSHLPSTVFEMEEFSPLVRQFKKLKLQDSKDHHISNSAEYLIEIHKKKSHEPLKTKGHRKRKAKQPLSQSPPKRPKTHVDVY